MRILNLCRTSLVALAIAVGGASGAAAQPEVAGATPPTTLSILGQDLELAGCGAREILWKDLYALGLYLPQARMAPSDINVPDTPVAIRLYAVYEGEVPEKIPEEWRSPLQRKLPSDLMTEVQQFFDRISSGDVATIAYAPDTGTVLQINGEPVTELQGHQLTEAMLELWVGENPVSEEIKQEILQGGC